MASLSQDVTVSQVYDPRISVQNTILDTNTSNVNFVVNRVTKNTQFFNQVADTTSNGQVAFNNVTIDPNTGMSSMLIVTTPVTLRLVAAAGSVGNLLNTGGDAPRPSLFMKNSANLQLTLNGTTMSEQTRYYLHALAHYGFNYTSLLDQYSFTMRSCVDNDFNYTIGNNNCVLNGYADMSVVTGIMPRGAYEGLNYVIRTNTPTEAIVDILFTDVIPISPLNISDYPKYCIPGINQLSVQISMNPLTKFLWSHSTDSGSIIDDALSQVFIGTNYPPAGPGTNPFGTQATLYYQLYDVPRELTGGVPPSLRNYVYPYYYSNSYSNLGPSAILPGQQSTITSTSVTPQGIPKFIYVWAEMDDVQHSNSTPYWFLSPLQVTVNFLNKQNSLTSVVSVGGQPTNTQLYNLIAVKNGFRGTIAEWLRTPVLCITSEELNLDDDMLTGMAQQSTLSITMTVRNNHPTQTVNSPTLYMTLIYEGAMFYSGAAGGGMFSTVGNIISPSILQNAQIVSSQYYHIDKQNQDYMGGLSLKELFAATKSAAKKAAPYVVSGIKTAAKYAPLALAALGAGSGGGFVGGSSGGGYLGGRQMDRKMLRDRL